MKLRNTATEYGLIARFFHWSIAFLIMGLLPVGLFMSDMDNTPLKLEVFALHKSFGLLVFFLGLARIVWRFILSPPERLSTHKGWEHALASAAHVWLYICVIGMPLSGWLMSSAGEFPIPFFGTHLPALIGKDQALAGIFNTVHETLAFTLLFVLALHIAGALKHHVIERDTTLLRMGFLKGRLAMPIVVVIVAGLSFAACGFLLLRETLPDQTSVADERSQDEADENITAVPEGGWSIVKNESTLTFETTLYNSPLHGQFKDFSGSIVFDPANLTTARADIRIGLNSVDTGDKSRDDTLREETWFNTQAHPHARFISESFQKKDADNYTATGTLNLRGAEVPVTLPFTLSIDGDTAHMAAQVDLDRLAFGIGKGEWEDESTVGHKVTVKINLTATR